MKISGFSAGSAENNGNETATIALGGYNLIISAQRDSRRLIAVVLGGASGKSRNLHMQDLVERGFKVMGVAPVKSLPPVSIVCLLYTSPSPRDKRQSRMPSSA